MLPVQIEEKGLTINDIARELEISSTTVSRAISGKGRVSEETKKKVNDYIKEHGYRPSGSTACLMKAKTGNLGVVLPSDPNVVDTPFFLGCLVGICEAAATNGYNTVVVTDMNNSYACIRELAKSNTVDGVILTRAFDDETQLMLLKQQDIPFVLIGSSRDAGVIQVDNDVFNSCSKLTKILLSGSKTVGFIGGEQSIRANKLRYEGFLQAFFDREIPVDKSRVFLNMNSKTLIDQAMAALTDLKTDCIITSDDVICGRVLGWLHNHKYRIPEEVKVASFYNSNNLTEHNPPVTAINVSPKEMGTKAANVLLSILDGQQVKQHNSVNYEILLRRSTM